MFIQNLCINYNLVFIKRVSFIIREISTVLRMYADDRKQSKIKGHKTAYNSAILLHHRGPSRAFMWRVHFKIATTRNSPKNLSG